MIDSPKILRLIHRVRRRESSSNRCRLRDWRRFEFFQIIMTIILSRTSKVYKQENSIPMEIKIVALGRSWIPNIQIYRNFIWVNEFVKQVHQVALTKGQKGSGQQIDLRDEDFWSVYVTDRAPFSSDDDGRESTHGIMILALPSFLLPPRSQFFDRVGEDRLEKSQRTKGRMILIALLVQERSPVSTKAYTGLRSTVRWDRER